MVRLRPCAMTRHPLPFLAIFSAAIVMACSSVGAPSASPAPASLDGHTYLSTDLQGAALVPGTRVRLAFADGSLNANGGCNTMGGTYSINSDRLKTSQMFMTEMGCDDPRMQQDDWLARFLGNVSYTLDGDTLTLADGSIRLTLVDKDVATPDQPLEGTRWRRIGRDPAEVHRQRRANRVPLPHPGTRRFGDDGPDRGRSLVPLLV